VDYQLQRAATVGQSSNLAPALAVGPVAARIVDSLRKVYRDKGVELKLAVDDSIVFRGDEGDLMELLGNLLDNACKWCRRTVRLSAAISNGELALSVEDDGPGIEASLIKEILQRGIRADQTIPGHGIGLAVVRDITQAYGGDITIGTGALGGAAFTVRLPHQP